jgi:hypothetical protein
VAQLNHRIPIRRVGEKSSLALSVSELSSRTVRTSITDEATVKVEAECSVGISDGREVAAAAVMAAHGMAVAFG